MGIQYKKSFSRKKHGIDVETLSVNCGLPSHIHLLQIKFLHLHNSEIVFFGLSTANYKFILIMPDDTLPSS